jgi:MFS family permease
VDALIEAPAAGPGAPLVAAAFATAVLALAAFLVVERRHPAPMLPLRLFHSRIFSGANLLTLLLYAALGGGLYFVPLNLIQVQGYSETAAGAALLPFILTMFLLSRWAGGLVDRHGPRLPLMIGPMVAAGGFLLFAVPGAGGSYWTTYMPAALVLGLGMTVTVAPLTATVMNALDRNLAGAASGINNAVSRVAALLAIALLGIVMSRVFDAALERRLRDAAMPAPYAQMALAQKARLGAIALPEEVPAAAREAIGKAVGDAFVEGFRRVMVICALLAVGSAVCAWGMIGRKG